jgi:hypothetical protein
MKVFNLPYAVAHEWLTSSGREFGCAVDNELLVSMIQTYCRIAGYRDEKSLGPDATIPRNGFMFIPGHVVAITNYTIEDPYYKGEHLFIIPVTPNN